MRRRTFAGKLLLFAPIFMGFGSPMSARSQTNAWLTSYTGTGMSIARQIQEQGYQARTISSILADARKVFDVDFIYESKVIPNTRVVMEIDKYKSVEDFLEDLLRPYNLKYKKVLSKAYVIYSNNPELKRLISSLIREDGMAAQVNAASAADARSGAVTGKSLDDKGAALEGVSVNEKGSNKETNNDKDGN